MLSRHLCWLLEVCLLKDLLFVCSFGSSSLLSRARKE